jgi:hypothetical protein
MLRDQNGGMVFDDLAEYLFPLEQRNGANIPTVVPQTIERIKHWLVPSAKPLIEPGPSVLIQ